MHVDHVATGQDDQSPKKPQKFYQILYVQVIFAIVAGIPDTVVGRQLPRLIADQALNVAGFLEDVRELGEPASESRRLGKGVLHPEQSGERLLFVRLIFKQDRRERATV